MTAVKVFIVMSAKQMDLNLVFELSTAENCKQSEFQRIVIKEPKKALNRRVLIVTL